MTYVASLLALALAPPLADAAPSDPYAGLNDRLRQVLERFDAAQVDVRSLSARFVEFKEIGLLKNAVTQEGQFYHSKPDKFLWEYTAPDPKLLLMNGTSLVAYYPNHKQAEVIQTRLSRKLVKYFGLGQVFADLRNYYDLSLLDDDTVNGARAISMTPRRKRLAKSSSSRSGVRPDLRCRGTLVAGSSRRDGTGGTHVGLGASRDHLHSHAGRHA